MDSDGKKAKAKVKVKAKLLSRVPLFATPTDCILPGFSVHGILQARIPEWVVIPFCG